MFYAGPCVGGRSTSKMSRAMAAAALSTEQFAREATACPSVWVQSETIEDLAKRQLGVADVNNLGKRELIFALFLAGRPGEILQLMM